MANPAKSVSDFAGTRPIKLWLLGAAWALATVVFFIAADRLRYSLAIDDGIAYMRIAENYAAGRLSDALNAFWSPLISWSMLPFMAGGIGAQAAFFFANALWSSIGLAAGILFTWRWSHRNFVASALVGIVLAVLYEANLGTPTPDLLVVTWTIIFTWAIVEVNDQMDSPSRRRRIWWGVGLGVVLALGYFAKAYTVPVFLVVGASWLAVRFVTARRSNPRGERLPAARRLLWTPVAAIAVFLILIAPFVVGISAKYGGVTFGSSAEVNTQGKLDAPAKAQTKPSLNLPAPPNEHAIYFAYDPTVELGTPAVGATAHKSLVSRIAYYVHQRVVVLPVYLNNIAATSPFALLIAALAVLLLAFGLLDPRRHRAVVFSTAVLVVYFLGYLAITTQASGGGRLRYHWPLLAISAIIVSLLWPSLWERTRGKVIQRVIAIILILLTPISAVRQIGLSEPVPFATQPTTTTMSYVLHPARESGSEIYADHLRAAGIVRSGDRIAASSGRYVKTLLYAFYLRAQLYGRQVPNDYTDPRFQQMLRDEKVQYFFLYQAGAPAAPDVSSWGSIAESTIMKYGCGSVDGVPSTSCRLSIVAVRP